MKARCPMSMGINDPTALSRFKAEGLSPFLSWLMIFCLLDFPPVVTVGPTASFSALKHCLGFPFLHEKLFRNSVCAYPYRDSYAQLLDALGSFGTNRHYMNTRLDFSINRRFSFRQKPSEQQRVPTTKVGGHQTSLSFELIQNQRAQQPQEEGEPNTAVPSKITAATRERTQHRSSLPCFTRRVSDPNVQH